MHPFDSWQIQPPFIPDINWDDPITRGLIGLIWTGPPVARDLVAQPFPLATSGDLSPLQTPYGVATNVATVGGYGGIYSPRNGYAQWKLAAVPLTFAVFCNHTTPARTSSVAGTSSSGLGYGILDLFGTRSRRWNANVGGTLRTYDSGTWGAQPTVKAMSVSDTQLVGYEGGVRIGATSWASASALTYDDTYGRLHILGTNEQGSNDGSAFWMALWNRFLEPFEHLRIGRDPWCWAAVPQIILPSYYQASSSALLGGATVTDLTSSSFRPRVNILSLPT